MSKFLIAYANLLALKKNLPDDSDIEEYYVDQYHEALEGVKDIIGEEATESFRIDFGEVKPIVTGGNYVTGEINYSKEEYCDRPKILAKIDGLLNYLALQSPAEDRKKLIGFHPDERDD